MSAPLMRPLMLGSQLNVLLFIAVMDFATIAPKKLRLFFEVMVELGA